MTPAEIQQITYAGSITFVNTSTVIFSCGLTGKFLRSDWYAFSS